MAANLTLEYKGIKYSSLKAFGDGLLQSNKLSSVFRDSGYEDVKFEAADLIGFEVKYSTGEIVLIYGTLFYDDNEGVFGFGFCFVFVGADGSVTADFAGTPTKMFDETADDRLIAEEYHRWIELERRQEVDVSDLEERTN